MKNQTSMETMQRLASQMDGLSIASRGLRSAIRPAKKIVALPKRVQKENKKLENFSKNSQNGETKSNITISNYRSVTDSAICSENYVTENSGHSYEEPEKEHFHEKFSKNDPKYLDLLSNNSVDQSETESELSSNENYELKNVSKKVTFDQATSQRRGPAETTSGYGSETSTGTGSSSSSTGLANQSKAGIETEFNDESGSSGVENGAHCVRCHKIYDPNSKSTAELRCSLPHPTKSVIPIKRDAFGTDFVCLCCRTEFRLPKMAFYEAGVNSMLTGFCFIGQHTQDASEIDYQQDGGAALCCEEAGCIEYFV